MTVSPGRGIRPARTMRSVFELPTTTILGAAMTVPILNQIRLDDKTLFL
jgi:hypothetical protein